MKSSVVLNLDGVRIRTRRQLPPEHRGPVRRLTRELWRQRRHRIRAGVHQIMTAGGAFPPTVHTFTASGTETVPFGSTTMTAELFGATGGGSGGTGTGCTANNGTGGGSGGYSKTIMAVALLGGTTITVTIGSAGAAGASAGGTGGTGTVSTYVAGTITGFATMTCNSGTGGNNAGGTVGGTASGGVNTNTTGNGQAARNQNGAVGLTGTNGNGLAGGNGGNPGTANPGFIGNTGKGYFGYV